MSCVLLIYLHFAGWAGSFSQSEVLSYLYPPSSFKLFLSIFLLVIQLAKESVLDQIGRKIQEIVLLYKGGSPKDCTNYRTIALLNHASKILLIILPNRLRQKFEDELPDEQAGFRRGRGTADMLCCIQNVIEKTLQMSERTFIVFIDYSKAFDSVSHIQMFDILNDMGFPRHIVALSDECQVRPRRDTGQRYMCIRSPSGL